jgi:hypothetical protein
MILSRKTVPLVFRLTVMLVVTLDPQMPVTEAGQFGPPAQNVRAVDV